MFAGFKPLKPLLHVESDRLSEEECYWNRLKEVSVFQESGNVTSTDFSPIAPYNVATTFSNTVSIYDTISCVPIASYSKVKSPLHCVAFRSDGQILAVGAHGGLVRLLRVAPGKHAGKCSLHPIQNFPKAHKHSVNCVAFAPPNGVNFISLADDGAVRLWDLADSRGADAQPLWTADKAHADQARSAVFAERNPNILITGAYDHKFKLWDVRADGSDGAKMEINHGAPLEKVLLFPNETIVASAGATTIKLWDIAAGGKLLHTMENHFKTVTSLCFATNRNYLLSGGLDRRINLFRCNSGDFALVKSWKVAAPVLSLSMSADDNRMAFGMSNLLSIYRRKTENEIFAAIKSGNALANGYMNDTEISNSVDGINGTGSRKRRYVNTAASFPLFIDPQANASKGAMRRVAAPPVIQRQRRHAGQPLKVMTVELTARHANQLRMGQLDKPLRDRHFREFFTLAITRCGLSEEQPEFAVAALQQLRVRQKMALALSGHPESVLLDFLKFLELNLFKAPFFDILSDVLSVFLKVYAEEQMSSKLIDAVDRLKLAIFGEIEVQRELGKFLGVMTMVAHRPAVNALRNAAMQAAATANEIDETKICASNKPGISNLGHLVNRGGDAHDTTMEQMHTEDSGVDEATDDTTNDTINTTMADTTNVSQRSSGAADVIIVNAEHAKKTIRNVVWSF